MRKVCITALLLMVITSAYAFDFGATVDESFLYTTGGSVGITNYLKTTLWTYVGRQSRTILNARISFTNQAYAIAEETPDPVSFPFMFDIDELAFGFNYPSGRVILGRYLMTEPTGAIFTHKVDGISLRYSVPLVNFAFDFGFTGLLWKNVSAVSPSLIDAYFAQEEEVFLGSPRVIGALTVTPAPIFRQSLRVGAIVQEDTRTRTGVISEGELAKQPGLGGLLDTQYLFLHISGPILPILYYSTYFSYGVGRSLSYINDVYGYSNISSFLAGAKVQLFLQEIAFSLVEMRLLFGSGDSDATSFWESNTAGYLQTFVSLTGSPSGIVFSPDPGNIILGELSYSMKPAASASVELLKSLQIAATGLVFFRSTTGFISEPGIPAESTEQYLGSEVDLSINSRPFSDLGFSVAGGIFFPSAAFTTDDVAAPEVSLRATVSMSF